MSQQPLDDNYKPIDANLYDASGNQYVSPMAGTVTTDSGGEKYAPHVVNLGDGTTPTQKLAIDSSGNASVSVAEINGVAPSMGNGASGTGVQRVTIANDSTGQVALATGSAVIGVVEIGDGTTPTQKLAIDASGNASVNIAEIAGAAPPIGHGLAATAIRVELPTDGTGVVGLNAGSNLVGGVEIYDSAGVNKLAVSAAGEASVDVAKIAGAAVPLGHGLAATAIRVELPTDGTGMVGLNAVGGSALAFGQAAMAASLPVAIASDQSDVGTVPHAGATGGATPYHLSSAATNNATNLKASAGNLYGYAIHNTSVGAIFAKFYNKATAPAPADDAALLTWIAQIPAASQVTAYFPVPIAFSTGIGFATVTGAGDTDNTAVGAGDLILNIIYK